MDALYLPPNILVDLTTSICRVPVRPTTESLCSYAFACLGESSLLGQGKMDVLYLPPNILVDLTTSICGVPVRPTTESLCSYAFACLGESSLL